jgi:perosamine synthetase
MIIQIEPWIDSAELEELKRVVTSTFVVEHELTKEFEERTRELTGSKYAVAMTNGTVALYCCLKALDIGPGDEVIVPNLTFIASANAVIMAGATPVFAEIEANTLCLDVSQIENLLTKRTKAIMPVHLYGQSADMDSILPFAKQHGLKVIEDAAQGVGVKFNGKHVGTFGELGILSYYGNKTITCGEGGIVLTNDEELAKTCYRLKNHGREKKGIFIHDHIGFNFAFTEMQAAVGISQMKKLPEVIAKKKLINSVYLQELKDISGFKSLFVDKRCEPVFWFTSFLADNVETLSAYMQQKGIQTRRFFYPLHLQPCYQKNYNTSGNFTVSEDIYSRGISLPSSYHLSEEEQASVIKTIRDFYNENRH